MSGIVAIVRGDGGPVDRALLDDLTDFQAFRGPDGPGVWASGEAGLGHTHFDAGGRRGGRQPVGLDGALWVTAHARLDARPELVEALRGRGQDVPDDAGDAELILHAYRAWGDDCPAHLLGDFAFALWDQPRRRLLCAVDHFRVKSLYYARAGPALVVSNTLDCVRQHPEVSDRLDEEAVGDFLLFGRYQAPELTIVADIRRLPPAHRLTWEGGTLRVSRYWSLPLDEAGDRPDRDCLARFDERLARAVDDRLPGGRIGVLLGGGIDSAMVAAMARRVLDGRGGPATLHAFTASHERTMPDREGHFAELAARALGIPHERIVCDFTLEEWTGPQPWPWPEPLESPLWSWSSRTLRTIASGCPHVLTGIDGDTLLLASLPAHWRELMRAGRPGRAALEWARYAWLERRLPPVGLRTALRRTPAPPPPVPPLPAWLGPELRRRADLPERWAAAHRRQPSTTSRQWPRDVLSSPAWFSAFDRYDASWVGAPLEAVHPLMDVRLLTWALEIAAFPWCHRKELFRRWLRPLVPAEVHRRPKTPLVDDPVRILLHTEGTQFAGDLAWEPALGNYIDSKELTERPDPRDLGGLYLWLRPFSLNVWLKGRRGRRGTHEQHPSKREQRDPLPAAEGPL